MPFSSPATDDTLGTEVIRIATRNSPLAMWQAEHVAECLERLGVRSELVPLVSRGDVDMRPFEEAANDKTRQTGVFTKRIQQALLDDEADVAVHSLKDLPTEPISALCLAAVPDREEVRDALVSHPDCDTPYTIATLPQGARVGTGSKRRAAQLLHARPDLKVEPIRGNVQTRLEKLDKEGFAAIVLAEAGLLRLEMSQLARHLMPLESMLPAPGQGALGIEVRSDDERSRRIVGQLDDTATRAAVTAERSLLAELHGGCLAPIAALGLVAGDTLLMTAVVLAADGSQRIDESDRIPITDDPLACGLSLGRLMAEAMASRGAHDLIGRDAPG